MNISGVEIHSLAAELFPLCRSITGDGTRQSLARLAQLIPITVHEVPTGATILDWTVPKEWNIKDAYIANSEGERLVDFRQSNLHVVNYSVPVEGRMTREALRKHVHTLPDQPELIPYRTSYYKPNWGFCLSQRLWDDIPEGEYDVRIDSTLEDGSLTWGECVILGQTEDEVLISAHNCHPSMANDNLSGVCVAAFLAKLLLARPAQRLTYRILFAPATIGAVAWLAANRGRLDRIRHGLVLNCIGDASGFNYKRSGRGNTEIDRAMVYLLRAENLPHRIREFTPYGYDERQFCSPGFNLPVGCLSRAVHGEFSEYHTSADNLNFIKAESLAESFRLLCSLVELLEYNAVYINQAPYGEPQLGKRSLYHDYGGSGIGDANLAKLWILNLSNGSRSLLDIGERSHLPFSLLLESAIELEDAGLIRNTAREPALGLRTAS